MTPQNPHQHWVVLLSTAILLSSGVAMWCPRVWPRKVLALVYWAAPVRWRRR